MRQLIDQIVLILLVTGIFATSHVVANDRLSADRLVVPDFVDIQVAEPEYRQATFNFSVPVDVERFSSDAGAIKVICSMIGDIFRPQTSETPNINAGSTRVPMGTARDGTQHYRGNVGVTIVTDIRADAGTAMGDASFGCQIELCADMQTNICLRPHERGQAGNRTLEGAALNTIQHGQLADFVQ